MLNKPKVPGPSIDPKTININQPAGGQPESKPPDTPVPRSVPACYFIDSAQPLEADTFPNQRSGMNGITLPTTIPNVNHMLTAYGVTVRYDVIKKKLDILVPGSSGCPDNADNSSLAQIYSLATLNNLSIGQMAAFVDAIGDRQQYNPVAEWITGRPWDGQDRLPALCDTLVARDDFPADLKRTLLKRWLLSAVAAALMPSGFRARGVLTLQGPQSIGKTAWVSALVPNPVLRDAVIKLDHHLDAGNKDSQISAISHWIVEIGELDSSFKKDIARLKGFISSDRDKVRRPYAKVDSVYPRRTVFCATVNDPEFLVDDTGNTRWWTIPVITIDDKHGIDMQQLFAQLAVDFQQGEQWWLTAEEEERLESQNKGHRRTSVVRELLLTAFDLDLPAEARKLMSTTEALKHVGIERPTNPQCKEATNIFREFLGEHKRINGTNKWNVPFRGYNQATSFSLQDDTSDRITSID